MAEEQGADLSFRRFLREIVEDLDKRERCIIIGLAEFLSWTGAGYATNILIGANALSIILTFGGIIFGVLRLSYWIWRSDQV